LATASDGTIASGFSLRVAVGLDVEHPTIKAKIKMIRSDLIISSTHKSPNEKS